MIFIFPPLFYLRLAQSDILTPGMILRLVSVMVIGTAGMVSTLIGTIGPLLDSESGATNSSVAVAVWSFGAP